MSQISLLEDLFEVQLLNPKCHESKDWVKKLRNSDDGSVPVCTSCEREHRAPEWGSRVSRVECTSENYELELLLDVNTQIFPLNPHDRFTLVMTTTLDLAGGMCDGSYDPLPMLQGKKTLADKFDYVMHGRVYNVVEETTDKMGIFVSFGGLLMRLRGDARNLQSLQRDKDYYLLLRRA
eukprot:m.339106 g.339106  ORF g.339106 m.339106 type:complete len:179 (+) comp18668_c0_seq1:122-658(+)